MAGAEFTSAQFFTDDLKVALANHSGRGIKMGTVEFGGHTFTFAPYAGTGSASFDILERWHDPHPGSPFRRHGTLPWSRTKVCSMCG